MINNEKTTTEYSGLKRVGIFGSTGSIGTQALEIIDRSDGRLIPVFLSCAENVKKLKEQIEKYDPEAVCVGKEIAEHHDENDASGTGDEDIVVSLKKEYPGVKVFCGAEGLVEAAAVLDIDVMLNSLVGISGLAPTLSFIGRRDSSGRKIALANKETLVTGGRFVTEAALDAGLSIKPVDSEHSAIYQCLRGNDISSVRRIILTASGGPFRGWEKEQLVNITPEQALAHPNWNMGAKITIDSATMINKAFEIIEAKWLFGLSAEQIDVVIHPQSIAHSFVEFKDGMILSQLGAPDMRPPISYALSMPDRWEINADFIDFAGIGSLEFEAPGGFIKRSLDLAYKVLRHSEQGFDSPSIVLNGANEELVAMFLRREIAFPEIIDICDRILEGHEPVKIQNPAEIFETDKMARSSVGEAIRELRQ